MRKEPCIAFAEVPEAEYPSFIKKLQQAFSIAVIEAFGTTSPLPSEADIAKSLYDDNTEKYYLLSNNQQVGGVVLMIDDKTQINSLDLFFIMPEFHSLGIGSAAWQAIEAKYPATKIWRTITPYFEQRNIHFYVNKCGFRIVEFFNKYHMDPNMPPPKNENGEIIAGADEYFLFEKVMQQ